VQPVFHDPDVARMIIWGTDGPRPPSLRISAGSTPLSDDDLEHVRLFGEAPRDRASSVGSIRYSWYDYLPKRKWSLCSNVTPIQKTVAPAGKVHACIRPRDRLQQDDAVRRISAICSPVLVAHVTPARSLISTPGFFRPTPPVRRRSGGSSMSSSDRGRSTQRRSSFMPTVIEESAPPAVQRQGRRLVPPPAARRPRYSSAQLIFLGRQST
jgi:hypothetical protein